MPPSTITSAAQRPQYLRFIGGKWHGLFRHVEAGARRSIETGTGEKEDGPMHVGDVLECVKHDPYGESIVPGVLYTVERVGNASFSILDSDGDLVHFDEDAEDRSLFRRIHCGSDETYTRRELTLVDNVSRYVETCFVLSTIPDNQARVELRKLIGLVYSARIPQAIETTTVPCRASSVIEGIAYDADSRTLDVTLHGTNGGGSLPRPGGPTYRYSGVDVALLGSFLTAPSLGEFYNQRISGKFPGTQL